MISKCATTTNVHVSAETKTDCILANVLTLNPYLRCIERHNTVVAAVTVVVVVILYYYANNCTNNVTSARDIVFTDLFLKILLTFYFKCLLFWYHPHVVIQPCGS